MNAYDPREWERRHRLREVCEAILTAASLLRGARLRYIDKEGKAREKRKDWSKGMRRFQIIEGYTREEQFQSDYGFGLYGEREMERRIALLREREAYLAERAKVEDHVTRLLEDVVDSCADGYADYLKSAVLAERERVWAARDAGRTHTPPAYLLRVEPLVYGPAVQPYLPAEPLDPKRHRQNRKEADRVRKSIATARRYIEEARIRYLAERLHTSRAKAADLSVFDQLSDYRSEVDILDCYGWGFITENRSDRLRELWSLRAEHLDKDGRYMDTTTEIFYHVAKTCGLQYKGFLDAVREEGAQLRREQAEADARQLAERAVHQDTGQVQ